APRIEIDGAISPEEQDRLFTYYDLGGSQYAGDFDFGTTGHDTSGPNTDTAMTRSEEQLHVGTENVETGRARLRKYIVTEEQTVTVPVTREEVRLEREPITDGNVGQAMNGADLSEEEHEVVLSEERVVVDKETVPVERVKLDKDTVTENQRVSEDVRKEKIELDEDARR
uniref:YsnF/AvaK domain-containing protein n=1 Tax=Agromyces humi TaxID=1766800 RepID=UPI0013571CE9